MNTEQNHSRPAAGPPVVAELSERSMFPLVAVVAGLFVLTILILIASAFGDPDAPINRWLNRNATPLILIETAILACVAVGSMMIDRFQTLRRQKRMQQTSGSVTATSGEKTPEDSTDVG